MIKNKTTQKTPTKQKTTKKQTIKTTQPKKQTTKSTPKKQPKTVIQTDYTGMINEFKHIEPMPDITLKALKKLTPNMHNEPIVLISLSIAFSLSAICYYSKNTLSILNTTSTIASFVLIILYLTTNLYYININKTTTPFILKKTTKPPTKHTKSTLKKYIEDYESTIILQTLTGFISLIIAITTLYKPIIDIETEHTIAIASAIYFYITTQTILSFKDILTKNRMWIQKSIAYKYMEMQEKKY